MKYTPEKIQTTELCSYGCNQIAKYKNKSNKLMCCENHNTCPANKKKNSNGLEKAYKNGGRENPKEIYMKISQEKKDKMNWNKGNRFADFSFGGKGQHKNALLKERGHKCECCNNTEWLGQPITLELEHVDGNRQNNTRENLKLLCPNCHSQTPTWRGRNIKGFKVKKYSDDIYVEAIKTSKTMQEALRKLELKNGAAVTLVNIMGKYMVKFLE